MHDLATTYAITVVYVALHLSLPLRFAQPDHITLPHNPHLLVPLLSLQSCTNRCTSNDLSILRPEVLQRATTDRSHEIRQHAQPSLRRTAVLSTTNKQTRSHNNGTLEADVFDGFLELALHLQVAHHRRSVSRGSRHEHICLRAGSFGTFGESEVQVIVDLSLGGE